VIGPPAALPGVRHQRKPSCVRSLRWKDLTRKLPFKDPAKRLIHMGRLGISGIAGDYLLNQIFFLNLGSRYLLLIIDGEQQIIPESDEFVGSFSLSFTHTFCGHGQPDVDTAALKVHRAVFG
jgi:hypothetical protein